MQPQQPPDTQWTGNPNQKVSLTQGNVAFDSASTPFDSSSTNFDGAPTTNLINVYTPNDTLWAGVNPE